MSATFTFKTSRLRYNDRPLDVEIEYTIVAGGIGAYEFWGSRGTQTTKEVDDFCVLSAEYGDTNEPVEDIETLADDLSDEIFDLCCDDFAAR